MKPPKVLDAIIDTRTALAALDAIVDKILAQKPKAKSKPARKRARRAKKIAQAADV